MKRNIYIHAGHTNNDPGAVANGYIEHAEALRILNACVDPIIDAGFGLIVVPEDLALYDAIEYINKLAPDLWDGLAIDIHLNSNNNPNQSGTESYYYTGSKKSKQIAEIFSRNISETLGIKNNGAMPDTSAAVGTLGFIRETNCWAVLLEICYISNKKDMEKLDYNKTAQGILKSIKEYYN